MITIGKLTNAQYELLCACFKNGLSTKNIRDFTGISYRRILAERERWNLCVKISNMAVKQSWNRRHPSNSSKVFSYS